MRPVFFACIFVFCIFFTASARAEAQTVTSATLLKQLLDLPAPPPVDEEARKSQNVETVVREEAFFSPDRVPPDDAPIEDLIAYWSRYSPSANTVRRNLTPSEKTLERILEYCEENPPVIHTFLGLLPTDPKVAASVKRSYDKMLTLEDSSYVAEQTKKWLVYNSDFFIDELLKKAEKVRDKDSYVINQEELRALARVNWDRALPILERLSSDNTQPVSQTLAHWAFYARAIETENEGDVSKYRRLLQETVENRSLSPGNRDLAMDALVVEKSWDGREDWYVSLLGDETLYNLGNYTGLTTILRFAPPEKMIPAMAKLIDSKNPAARQAAVRNLVSYLREEKIEAVRALLPWLSNPDWFPEIPDGRNQLIAAVGRVDLPEAVPALVTILMNEEALRYTAADALARYKDPRAIPALKIALAAEKNTSRRISFIRALEACGGLTDDEKMSSLEQYAAVISTPEGMIKFFSELYKQYDDNTPNPTPVALHIGHHVSEQSEPSDGLAMRAVERLKTLRKTKPEVAAALAGIMQKWRGRVIFIERLRQIRAGEADLETILTALAQRSEIREKIESEVFGMRAGNGVGRGIAACLSDDNFDIQSVLRQTDADAQTAALGCARLIRAKLAVAEVAALMKNANKLLALAAARYLESEDSTEARTLILEQHPGEAVILGARHAFIPDIKSVAYSEPLRQIFQSVTGRGFFGETYSAMQKSEDALRAEIKSNPDLTAIYGLLPNDKAGQQVIRVFKDKIVFTDYEDEARYRERTLSAREYEDFYRLLLEEKVDAQMPFLNAYCEECSGIEFVMFGKNGGRRVFMINSFTDNMPLKKILERFDTFGEGDLKLHYRLADKIKGLEVLLADDKFKAQAIWKNGGELRVLVEDKEKEAEIQKNLETQSEVEEKAQSDEDEEENNNEKYRRLNELREKRREEAKYAHISWRALENGALGSVLPQPLEMPYLYDDSQFPETDSIDSAPRAWKVRAGNYEIRSSNPYAEDVGLFKVSRGQSPLKFKEGNYDAPLVTPDGNWVVVSKAPQNWNEPRVLVRINLRTGKEFPVNLPPSDTFSPIAYIASQNKILAYRAQRVEYYSYRNRNADRDDEAEEVEEEEPKPIVRLNKDDKNPSPQTPEYYLVDPATGATQSVKGEFRPLEAATYRPLQQTSTPGEFWAAVYDKKAKETVIGRYNTNTFTLQPVTKLPQIALDSMNIWVDEKEAKVYFVYEGHVLAVPLTKE